jgi:uncharacterized protein with HEPN domain
VRDDPERLRDILEAIDRIPQRTRAGRSTFDDQDLIQVWVVHHIEIIGEAARATSEEIRGRYPDVPWGAMIAMRDTLVHDYFRIDLDEVWRTVEEDLPRLREQIETILVEQDAGSN